MTPEMSILDEAAAITAGARQADYGPPERNLGQTASMWSVILGVEVSARQVALCMTALKLARDAHKPKRDNLVDGAGYLHLASLCTSEPEPEPQPCPNFRLGNGGVCDSAADFGGHYSACLADCQRSAEA